MGLNGVGKTTLFNTIAQLNRADSGKINMMDAPVDSYEPKQLAKKLGYLLQSLSYEFPQTVEEFCINGLYPHINRWEMVSDKHKESIRQALKLTGLNGFEKRLIHTLSGGEKRRLEICGLLIQNPLIWLLDEPVNHLDLHRQIQMMDILMKSARKNNGSTISILHDPNLVSRYCSHVLMLTGEGQYKSGDIQTLFDEDNLSALFKHNIKAIKHEDKTFFLAE